MALSERADPLADSSLPTQSREPRCQATEKEGAACRLPPASVVNYVRPDTMKYPLPLRIQTERQRQSASPSLPLSLLTRASPGRSVFHVSLLVSFRCINCKENFIQLTYFGMVSI